MRSSPIGLRLFPTIVTLLLLAVPCVRAADDIVSRSPPWHPAGFLQAVLASVVFGLTGIVLALIGFKLFDWREGGLGDGMVHFACVRDHLEDLATTVYLQDTAMQAGLRTQHLSIDAVGRDGARFVDLENRPIRSLFKLYAWEWLINERFSPHLLAEPWRLIEPAWKMVLSNKAILPLIWEMFPGHPNLLAAYITPERLGGSYVRKPTLGREGAGITTFAGGRQVAATPPGDGGAGGLSTRRRCRRRTSAAATLSSARGSSVTRRQASACARAGGRSRRTPGGFVPHYFVP